MTRTDTLDHYLTDVATAIKNKYDISRTINASNFDTIINNGRVDAYTLSLGNKTGLDQQGIDDLRELLGNLKNVALGTFTNGTFTDASSLDEQLPATRQGMFQGCTNLLTIPNLNYSRATYFYNMFKGCTSITDASKFNNFDFTDCNCFGMFESSGITSAPTGMTIATISAGGNSSIKEMFRGCPNLTTIPYIDLSNFHGAMRYWCDCPSLTDESLNNILLSLSTSDGGSDTTHQLSRIFYDTGSTYASRLKQLSNYQACINAGWVDDLTS